ncbi:NAD(P)-binding domain-containing protein [Mycoplasmopsis cynos]|uniref:NAD(P)-binding domain-containing protein n=1 Tax=Mycoplasmopsis cynos TaxID=171284 RepID=UPI0024C5285C|nr:NAD(P)-binding domain-containing protein [Mycoplasmopsis cynos]WAM07546.1 NAD(P)-binding domain-containing protein [Mycoplasmopsis cynos]
MGSNPATPVEKMFNKWCFTSYIKHFFIYNFIMQKKYKFGFIGTGAFGSALANVLTTNNHKVIMYGINEQEVRNINNGNNRKYFENSEFTNPELISATMNFEYLVDNSEILMLSLTVNRN